MAWLAWNDDEFSETFGMDAAEGGLGGLDGGERLELEDEPIEYYTATEATWEEELELARYDELADLMDNDEISAEEEGWLRGAERIALY